MYTSYNILLYIKQLNLIVHLTDSYLLYLAFSSVSYFRLILPSSYKEVISLLHWILSFRYSQANVEMPLSDTGVSQRFSTCNFCRCSLINCRPASPNCVAHRFRYLSAGNFISVSAHADVTEVKAMLRHSRLPRARPPSRRATSASVARTGSVSFRGPPFCCWRDRDQIYICYARKD